MKKRQKKQDVIPAADSLSTEEPRAKRVWVILGYNVGRVYEVRASDGTTFKAFVHNLNQNDAVFK